MVERRTKILLAISVVVLIGAFIFLRMNEDSWIKDGKGVWTIHGNPSETPVEAREQQEAISCASSLYAVQNMNNAVFNSQCLGTCGNYSIDIVNVPRTSADDSNANKCSDYATGKTKYFIELNHNGGIVRIV